MNPTQQALLSANEINRLISQAGSVKNQLPLASNRPAPAGEQPSSVIGSGLDFADRQPYSAGDDPRYIDWRASARSAKTLVRRYHSELNTPSCLVIDRRASMAFGTRKRLKVTQALRAGITLGSQILQGGNPLACLLLDNPVYWQPAQSGLAAFRQTLQQAVRACPPAADNRPETGWSRISNCLHSRLPLGSRLILISDFLTLQQAEQTALRQLGQRFQLAAVQIIDPAEQQLPALDTLSLHWNDQRQQINNDPAKRQQLNQELSERLHRQAQWFTRSNCRLLRLGNADPLDSLHGWA